MSKLNLDLSGVNVFGKKTIVPTGRYCVTVCETEVKENKAKTGGYLQVSFSIQGGEHDGAIIVDRYNIQNPNENAVKMGLSKIKAIMTYGGHSNPNKLAKSDDLIGLMLDVAVTEDPHSFTGDNGETVETTQNNIQGFMEVKPQDNQELPPVIKTKEPAKKQPTKPKKETPKPEETSKESEQEFPWGS